MPRVKSIEFQTRWQAQLDDCVSALRWSPDGRSVAAAAVSGPIMLFESGTGTIEQTLRGHGFGTTDLAWRPDGSYFASAGQDGLVRVWDRSSGAERLALAGGAAWVEHVAWSPIGDYLASAAGKQLRLWNAAGELLHTYADHASTISAVQWKPRTALIKDEKPLLTSAAYGGLRFWLADQAEAAHAFDWKGSILALAWSPDGQYIATGDQDSTVHFWIVAQGKDLQMWGYPTKVRELAWDCASRYLATGGGTTVTVWDCSGKGPEGTRPLQLDAHEDLISALAFQHAGALLASGGQDGRVVIWEPGKSRKPRTQLTLNAPVTQLYWSPDDRRLAIGMETGEVMVALYATQDQ